VFLFCPHHTDIYSRIGKNKEEIPSLPTLSPVLPSITFFFFLIFVASLRENILFILRVLMVYKDRTLLEIYTKLDIWDVF
jgi:hypothetical protein